MHFSHFESSPGEVSSTDAMCGCHFTEYIFVIIPHSSPTVRQPVVILDILVLLHVLLLLYSMYVTPKPSLSLTIDVTSRGAIEISCHDRRCCRISCFQVLETWNIQSFKIDLITIGHCPKFRTHPPPTPQPLHQTFKSWRRKKVRFISISEPVCFLDSIVN